MRVIKTSVKRLSGPALSVARVVYKRRKLHALKQSYHAWARENEERCFVEQNLKGQPLVSVIVPVYNTVYEHLLQMVYSVVNQHYQEWELILVNASDNELSKRQVATCADIDTRIRVVSPESNKGIAGNTNYGISRANGEFVAFLDHDDLLHPCALHAVLEEAQKNKLDLIYSDEDKVNDEGTLFYGPFLKPDWSPDLLRNANYINHFTIIRKKYIDEVGGLRPDYDGAQDYDLLLRVIDHCAPRVGHVHRVLYHWRAAQTSTARDISAKTYILSRGEQAVNDHLQRTKKAAGAQAIEGRPGFYRVEYKPVKYSVVIGPTATDQRTACAAWLKELVKHSDENLCRVVVGKWFGEFIKQDAWINESVLLQLLDESQDYWAASIKDITEPAVVLFKVAAAPTDKKSLGRLAAAAMDDDHKAVAPMLVTAYGDIMHAGIVNAMTVPRMLFAGQKQSEDTYYGITEFVRNVDDISTAIVAYKTTDIKDILAKKPDYDAIANINQLIQIEATETVLWTHSVFSFRGVLSRVKRQGMYNTQLSEFAPDTAVLMDNWGDSHARAE